MKKLLFSALLLSTVAISAQETESQSSERQNDIMISPIELIGGAALNFSYERLLNKDSGVGINGLFGFKDNDNNAFSQISPYYRMYFGKKYGGGFFVEGFVPITSTKDGGYNYYNGGGYTQKNPETNTTVGAGIGFGGKWVARKNIIFELSSGIARRFGSGNFDKITGKGMLGIGYRF
ncbi:DUF3575 domain-containing protein [Halpernia sp.]|uniref:DUF3575 domain-containing protein n=1 Tax=Halpernia sp. TaxID=2782209 RepID=UPI003A921F0C